MHELLDSILVIGHHNPDTDAAASAAAYAHFLNALGRYDRPAVASVLGTLTPQTKHVFNIAKVEPPLLLENITPRAAAVRKSACAQSNCASLYALNCCCCCRNLDPAEQSDFLNNGNAIEWGETQDTVALLIVKAKAIVTIEGFVK